MPVDRMYEGTEPLTHPLTGDPIPLHDKDALFKAYADAGEATRKIRREIGTLSRKLREIEAATEPIVYALAGKDVTLAAAIDWNTSLESTTSE